MGDSWASISFFIISILELNVFFLIRPSVLRDSISCWNPIILELIVENILLKYCLLDTSVATFIRELIFAIKESISINTLSKLVYSLIILSCISSILSLLLFKVLYFINSVSTTEFPFKISIDAFKWVIWLLIPITSPISFICWFNISICSWILKYSSIALSLTLSSSLTFCINSS